MRAATLRPPSCRPLREDVDLSLVVERAPSLAKPVEWIGPLVNGRRREKVAVEVEGHRGMLVSQHPLHHLDVGKARQWGSYRPDWRHARRSDAPTRANSKESAPTTRSKPLAVDTSTSGLLL